jgi:hypothetical protein
MIPLSGLIGANFFSLSNSFVATLDACGGNLAALERNKHKESFRVHIQIWSSCKEQP